MKESNGITLETIVLKNSNLISSNIDEEIVMMSFKNNEYYGMNKAGSRIWQIIEEPTSVKVIIQALTREFNVEILECQKDVIEYLKVLHSKNLISVK
jgi:hypothetical protein